MEVNIENKVKQASYYKITQIFINAINVQYVSFKECKGVDHQDKAIGLIIFRLLSMFQDRLMLSSNTYSMQFVMFICLWNLLE